MRGIGRALQGLEGMGMPHWVVGLVFFGALSMFISFLMRHAPLGKARGLVRRAALADREERAAMEQEALDMVWDEPEGLLIVGQEAIRRDSQALAKRVIARLEEFGERRADVRKLEDALYGTRHPRLEAELATIQGFLNEELVELARPRLQRALKMWPDEEALEEQQQALWALVVKLEADSALEASDGEPTVS